MLNYQFDILTQTRKNVLNLVAGLTEAQMNHIPAGFNNNLIWNLGHIVVTQQLLCYRLAGLETAVPEAWIEQYRKGMKPTSVTPMAEITAIKTAFDTTLAQLQSDYATERFKTYKTYSTSFGLTLSSIQEAITFNNIHEGMHLGTMIALKKLV